MRRFICLIIFCGITIAAIAQERWPLDSNIGLIYIHEGDDLTKVLAQENKRYIIRHNHNLDGHRIVVGANSILDFQGGSIRGGAVVGNGCYIYGNLVFDHVNFTNSCRIDAISDRFISIVDEENLVDLFSLLNDEDFQVLEISKDYVTSTIGKQSYNYFKLMSHSKIVLDGTITVGTTLPNVSAYRVFYIADKNDIEICGSGALIGERETKVFNEGDTYEYGVGIGIYNSTNIFIHDITITKMIGDGIYITSSAKKHTENVVISNTTFTFNRRQGISLIAGNQIVIKNNTIAYTSGAQPEAAFDLEPNQTCQTSKNVFFCDNILDNNNDGIHIHNKKALVENVLIENNIARSRIANDIEDGFKQYDGCNIIIVNSGGSIRVKNQVIVNLVVYKNTGKINVDSCSIHQSLGFINTDDCSGSLSLNDCLFDRSVDLKQTWYTALIYTRKGAGELTNAVFNRCKFFSSNVNLFNTISVKNDRASKYTFNDCDIDVNSVLLCRANSVYNRCTIKCKRMKISLSSTKDGLVMEGNSISFKSNASKEPLLFIDGAASNFKGDYNLIMRNNVFTQPLEQSALAVSPSFPLSNLKLMFVNNSAPDSSGQKIILPRETMESIRE